MSAAQFSLTAPGRAPCGFPLCVLDAYHDGDHQISRAVLTEAARNLIRICVECGTKFIVYGEHIPGNVRTCDNPHCLEALCAREAKQAPLMCCCVQRTYPHELSIHPRIRHEGNRNRWPWSLMRSPRVEMSTEREAA